MIPIENVYYLLCYSWDSLSEKERVKVDANEFKNMPELFAKVLVNASNILLKRGIEKSYIDHNEEIPGIKGKFLLNESLKHNTLWYQKAICLYDDLSPDILSNQILFTTLYHLSNSKSIKSDLRKEIISAKRRFTGISLIPLTSSLFQKVKIHRNNRFYGFILNVCFILFESMLPDEKEGKYTFTDFTRDKDKMNKLFESFVRNFYRKYSSYHVSSTKISWQFEGDDNDLKYLPEMRTDITLENKNQKIIIDTKFYNQTAGEYFNKTSLHSNNLYQIFSYLIQQEKESDKITLHAQGMLLYPTITKEFNLDYTYKKHKIAIRTVNLNVKWTEIHTRLIQILDSVKNNVH